MKNSVFLRSYFLFKEKLVAHENIQLFRPPSERSQASGGFKVWAFLSADEGFVLGEAVWLQRKMWVLLPSVPTTGVNLQYDSLQQETTDAELIWQLWIKIKNLKKNIFGSLAKWFGNRWHDSTTSWSQINLWEYFYSCWLNRSSDEILSHTSQKPSAVVWWQFGNC